MVDTISVQSVDEFAQQLQDVEANTLDEAGARDLYEAWSELNSGLTDNDKLLVVEDWLTGEELGRRRPYMLGRVEYDDASKGAVLFTNLRTVDVSIFENHVLDDFLEMDQSRSMEDVLEEVDISDDNDYIDEAGLMWVPRSQMTVFERGL